MLTRARQVPQRETGVYLSHLELAIIYKSTVRASGVCFGEDVYDPTFVPASSITNLINPYLILVTV